MASTLKSVSDNFAVVVKSAGASTVRVDGRRRFPATGVVWATDGVIVTANHVVKRDEGIKLGLPDGGEVSAALVGRDPSTDLAVLRAEVDDLAAPTWAEADGDSAAVGNLVLALGRPGETVQATLGIVSALGKSWRTPLGGVIDQYLQTDVLMYPGFSGGPLVGSEGQILGLNTSAFSRGVSLTVPTSTVKRVVEALLKHGKVQRGYLGVSTQPVRLPEALATQLKQKTGLLLSAVEADSPAEKGGLVLGDTIVSLDGVSVRHHDDLLALLSGDRVGKETSVGIIRGGKQETLAVVVAEKP